MPHSHPFGKAEAVAWYADLRPETVVEIGPGAGMWSQALRSSWRGYWIGLEVWEPYVEKYGLLPTLYDEVRIGDVRETGVPEADLVIAGDVLEHLEQEEARALVGEILGRGCAFLVSVPVIHYEQGALEGNHHETHLWHPTDALMREWLKPTHAVVGDVVGAYWVAPK